RTQHGGYRSNFFTSPKTRPMRHPGIHLYGLKSGGEEFPGEVSLSPFYSGKKLLISAAIRDITERKKVEEQFKGLLESAPDAVVIANDSGEIVIVNAQTENLFGHKREELLGQKIETLIPERFREQHVGYRNNFFR